MPRILFYVKCRPQDADAWPIAKDNNRVFIGYPMYKAGAGLSSDWRKYGVHALLVDLGASDFDTMAKGSVSPGYKNQVTSNRRLANMVELGSIVLVPRVGAGVCYVAEISSRFELVDRPTWADTYLKLRTDHGLKTEPEMSHVGDIVQSWPVVEWRTLVFPALPRWISYRLLSRNTVGVINDLNQPKVSALETVRDLMELPAGAQYAPFQDGQDLEQALLTWLSPTSFEHLVVDLLRLEAADDVHWHHVGGSGDGGADGIAVDTEGKVRGVLQCKWHYDGQPSALAKTIGERSGEDVQVVVAILHGQQDAQPIGPIFTFWNLNRIAELVRRHAANLPIARTLQVGLTGGAD